ncbi:hypothetical protein NLG97_g2039 [Lecanicillium saksenae]|uniref:Uncharacterized protein n=1 Tax=Lecanicillium saksenae TaxID=468837 RepID=A0ACC1R290_9HYPO|nr:hypothetical protein NLG97_g2039 [Lecanicillium saksenae]
MCNQRCYIVPPHLLQAIADSTSNPEKVRETAKASLLAREKVSVARKDLFAILTQPRGYASGSQPRQEIVPPHILRAISTAEDNDDETRARAKDNLEHVEGVINQFKATQGAEQEEEDVQSFGISSKKPKPETTYRAVYDAQNTTDEGSLPGKLVREEGQEAVKDKAVNEAFDNVGATLKFYKEKFSWTSIDNRNAKVISSVHFGKSYENAFWDPSVRQMVFGDGGDFLNNFTASIDVIGHELTHAITEHTSPLDYQGQPGALNEHISDVFGIMVKQMVQNEKADAADWLIGEDCLLPGIKGLALRSMKEPGTAYNDPRFGKDPQVANMKDFKQMYEDNGGVHIFSGIPNKAFYLVAIAFGGYSWEKAGQIWWKTMNSGQIPARCTFLQFADVTVDIAEKEFKAGKVEDPDGGNGNDDDGNDGDDGDDGDGRDGDCDDNGKDDDDDGDCNKDDNGDDCGKGKDGKGGKGGKDGKDDDDEGDCGFLMEGFDEIRTRYRLAPATFASICKITSQPERSAIFQTACTAAEFQTFPIRPAERAWLRHINEHTSIPYPIAEPITEPWHKASLVVQIDLSGQPWPSKITQAARKELLGERGRIYRVFDQVTRCIIDVLGHRGDGRGEGSGSSSTGSELLQIDGIGAARLKRLSDAGIRTVRRLSGLECYHIERLMSRNPPYGQTLLRQLAGFPLLTLEVESLGEKEKKEEVDGGGGSWWMVRVVMGFENKAVPTWKGKTPWVSCVMENASDGRLTWFWRGSAKRLDGEGGKEIVVGVMGYQGCKLRVALACEVLVGTMVQKDMEL